MKLLVDCVPLLTGGGVQVAVSLLTNLCRQSDVIWHAVLPANLAPQLPAEIAADARITFLAKGTGARRLLLVTKLRRIEAAFGPDVVFTVFGPAYFRARAPHVVGFALPNLIYKRTGPIPPATFSIRLLDWLRCVLLRRADHIVVETETVRQRLARRLRIDSKRISVIGNSINPLLEPHSEGLNDTDAPAGPSIRFTIFTPSAYYSHKNLETIPRVAAAMHRQFPNLDFEFRLTLAEESAEWRRLATEASRLGVGARVVTMGILDVGGLARAYKAASAVFLPTLREASTAVYPESFFFGRPLVTSDLDFARELCGEAALFVPPLQPDKIASCLIELAQSADLRSMLVAAGNRQLARGYPSAAEKFSRQLEVLSQAASGKDSPTQGRPRHSVAIVLHFLSHYREAVYRHLSDVESGGNAHFIYSDTKSNIPSLKVLDFNSTAAATPTPGKITWRRLINVWFGQQVCWQKGVLSLAWRREHDTLIFMGSMYFPSSWLGCLIGRLRGKRILMWGHGFRHHERGLKGLVRSVFYRLAHGHLLYGHHAREIMLAKGFDPNDLYVIYNTLNIEHLNSTLDAFLEGGGRQPSPSCPGTLNLVMIGRITVEKQLDLLVEALAMLRGSGVEARLTVIGDGPDREAVAARAHTLGISDHIRWLGALYDESLICPHIATADLCVVPGKLGLTAVHAMTYGTPVVTHDDFGTHSPEFEVIVPGRTGMFFRKGDAEDLARTILSWQAQMHDRAILRQRCRHLVCTYYTPQMQRHIIDKAVDGISANHIPEASTRPRIDS